MPSLPCCICAMNTFCTLVWSPAISSTKSTRSAPAASRKTPGATREAWSRRSICRRYSSALPIAQGDKNSDSTATRATRGDANSRTGRTQARSERPEPNHHLRLAVAARKRHEHRNEKRQRQQHRKIVQGGKREQRDHALGEDFSDRRLPEQADELRCQRDGKQGREHRERPNPGISPLRRHGRQGGKHAPSVSRARRCRRARAAGGPRAGKGIQREAVS